MTTAANEPALVVTERLIRSILRTEFGARASHARKREGYRVRENVPGVVRVGVDFDDQAEARRVAAAMAERLRALGFAVRLSNATAALLITAP